jgi:phospholipid/cholesterol/gamma-HCH transport system substrate-binding protein
MNTEAKVGAFVLVSAAILLVSIYRISTSTIRGAHVSYSTYFSYAGGLEPGADVLFGGIKVGSVTAVRPYAQDPTRIEILMDVKTGTPLNAKSVAKLGSVTLVTSPVISISTGSNEAARIPPGGVIPSQETVALDDMERKFASLADSAHSVLSSAENDMNGITSDARQLMANMNDITGKPNQQRIEALLDQANGMVARISPKVDQITDQVQKLTNDVDQLAVKAGPVVDNANATVANANQTITDLREPLEKDLADLSKTLDQARGVIVDLRASMRAKDQDFTYTLENVRSLTDNLNDLTESLKQRPWSLIRIRQPQDRKVPQTASTQP